MMLGVEFVTDKKTNTPAPEIRDRVEVACFERGLIILGAGTNTIRWSPPLILTKENVDVAIEEGYAAAAAVRHARQNLQAAFAATSPGDAPTSEPPRTLEVH